jgi:hypothetical protein
MRKKETIVWVVMHYEYRRINGELLADCLLSRVSSTRRKAEEFIRCCSVSSYSWWQIYPKVVDGGDLPIKWNAIFYYSHRGTLLQSLPFKRAENAFLREEEKNRE